MPVRISGGPVIEPLLPDRITRQCFLTSPGDGGGDAPKPATRTAMIDAWTDLRASHHVCEPWTGETWFFEKGCTNRVPPHPVELMPSDPDEGDTGEMADAAVRILKISSTGLGWDAGACSTRPRP